MKKIAVLLMFVGALMSSCNGMKKSQESNSNNEAETYIVNLTKEEFLTKVANVETTPNEWKYLGDKPAIVDFYAPWCGPCKQIAPILAELAQEYKDRIVIYKVNTDEEQELTEAFNIRSIPTLLFVSMNGEPQVRQGAMSKEDLKEAIDKMLLNN